MISLSSPISGHAAQGPGAAAAAAAGSTHHPPNSLGLDDVLVSLPELPENEEFAQSPPCKLRSYESTSSIMSFNRERTLCVDLPHDPKPVDVHSAFERAVKAININPAHCMFV